MVREVVCVHVGQCGLQLGSSFWHSLTTEHSAQQQRAGAGAGKAAIGGGGGGGGLSAGRSSAAAPQRSAADRSSSTGEWWRWSAASPSASASASASSFSGGLSTFFQPVDSATASSSSALSAFPYRARAVLVDMESGVLSALSRSSQSSLFDSAVCVVSDVSGSGNNWAHGYCVFGPQYGEAVLESVRRQAEACDSLQAFVMTHSTGGGTGSGLGSYVLELLSDEYAGVYRIDQCVLPSLERDDVVTSPYNAALSLPTVCRSADVVLPVDNQALVDACDAFHKSQPSAAQTGGAHTAQSKQRTARDASAPQVSPRPAAAALIGGGFSELNVLCAGVLSSLTAGMRFPGDLNVDLSDLVMNCCPFTDTNLLVPALSPLHHILSAAQHSTPGSSSSGGAEHTVASSRRAVSGANSGERGRGTTAVPVSTAEAPSYYFHTLSTAQSLYSTQSSARHAPPAFGSSTRLSALRGAVEGSQSGRAGSAQEDALFQAALHKSNQLLQMDPLSGTYLSCALLCRGALSLGSVQRQVESLSARMRFVSVGDERGGGGGSWKLGLCAEPGLGVASSVLALSNTSAVTPRLQALHDRCVSLFGRRAHWHHYRDCGLEEQHMADELLHIRDTIAAYSAAATPAGGGTRRD